MNAPTTALQQVRTHRIAIAGAFLAQGLLFISLTLRLPQLKELFELSELAMFEFANRRLVRTLPAKKADRPVGG